MATPSPRSGLPQGFSVYQPALGAQLQFFPALGTQRLDDLINAHVPGPASIKDKRASVSLDFLGYARTTGQTFKFYPAAPSLAESPLTGSPPALDSASSSFNVSPVTSSWDWSATASVSSRSSTHRRPSAKVASSSTTSPPSRHHTTDFSSLPGMKILTKDGLDVTNSASRGSKTKEQRDHAHLMRIIKACDSCRRKKIRCDPSHKKRGGPPAHMHAAAATGSRPRRKAKSPPQEQLTPPQSQPPPQPSPVGADSSEAMGADALEAFLTSSLDLDFSMSHPETLDPLAAALPDCPWDDFMQFPPMDAAADYDFYLDPNNYFTSQSSISSSSASPFKIPTPQSLQEPGAPPGPDTTTAQGAHAASPQYPFLDPSGFAGDYTDFNLFSPQSSFSEDDRMLSVGSSSHEPGSSQHSQPGFDDWNVEAALPKTAGDSVGGVDEYDGLSLIDSTDRHVLPPGASAASAASLGGQVIICCAPGTVVLTADGYNSHVLDHVPISLSASSSAAAAADSSLYMPLEDTPSDRPASHLSHFIANPELRHPLKMAWLQQPRALRGTTLHLRYTKTLFVRTSRRTTIVMHVRPETE
ncbi:transcription factor Cys6 [Hirsutella rhossiliensis]|uniref:Transcription factor Cys6 n=1 Tax=Hirsutella rhossiliensis TaxID=111463 RepID=A0A9P8MPW5_9HYPO|nr:transcription factor Cys6 [Hirsutella rhossiliensis]KAH0958912.1 transcription factor Cys6 [Hirsutella rhossiliensis]